MRETILLTGAAGLVGGRLLERFLDREVRLLVTSHRVPLRPRRGRAEVVVVPCDLTREWMGLSRADHRRLARDVTAILHCAGRTDFSATRDAARRANVRPVENLLALADAAPGLRRIVLLSTVYVAGRRRGAVRGEDLTHRAGFVNEYERSRYEGEQIARHAMRRLPLAVHRLSTILCSRRGEFPRLDAVHHALRFFHAGLVPLVPGREDSDVDLITADYAVDAVDTLFGRFEPSATHQIAAGPRGRIAMAPFLAKTADLFAAWDPRWRERSVEIPPIATLRTFERLRRSVELADDLVLTRVMAAMHVFAPQLAYPKVFEDESTRAILREEGVVEDELDSFYPRFIRNAIESRWGKRAQDRKGLPLLRPEKRSSGR